MTYTVSITSQGQISIPAALRRKLGLDKMSQAQVSEKNGSLIIEPIPDLLTLKGSLKTNKKPLSNKELHEIVGQAMADEYAKSLKRM